MSEEICVFAWITCLALGKGIVCLQGLFLSFLSCSCVSVYLKSSLPPAPQQGQVDCWPLPCPPVDCEFTVVPEGECCPRCVTDPCQADTIRNDITKTCTDEHNISRFSGSSWIKHGTECTLCQCKVRRQLCRLPRNQQITVSLGQWHRRKMVWKIRILVLCQQRSTVDCGHTNIPVA